MFRGGVPPSQYAVMRAPFQEGDFPGPVKYGYLNVGVVEARSATTCSAAPSSASTRTRRAYVVPAEAVTVVPDDVPARRAVLAGTVETAVNALWDAAPLVGDRVAVVGAGMVGLLRRPAARADAGGEVTLVDVDVTRARPRPRRSARVRPARRRPRRPATSSFHTSGTAAGLQLSLDLLAAEGTVIELSWYGDTGRAVPRRRLPLARLGIRASQVGEVALARRGRRTDGGPAGARAGAAAGPRVRRAAHRHVRVRRAARRDGAAGRRPAPALCHTILRRRETDVQRHGPRPHDDRAQLSAATCSVPRSACTARRTSWTRPSPGSSSTPTASWWTSAGPPRCCAACWRTSPTAT